MPAREKINPEVLPRSDTDESVCEVLLRFGGIVLIRCQCVCECNLLGVAVMMAEVRRWHLLMSESHLPSQLQAPGT
jgi:hypothetical protein